MRNQRILFGDKRILVAVTLALLATLTTAATPASAATATSLPPRSHAAPVPVTRTPVTFTVTNPLNGAALEVSGGLYTAEGRACTDSVMLLVHGTTYGEYAWAFPVEQNTYSTAHALARAGYPALAIDRPGYGASDHPNGYTLTAEGYASMVGQIEKSLRAGSYGGPRTARSGSWATRRGRRSRNSPSGFGSPTPRSTSRPATRTC